VIHHVIFEIQSYVRRPHEIEIMCEEKRKKLLQELDDIWARICKTKFVVRALDRQWYSGLRLAVQNADLSSGFRSPGDIVFFHLLHKPNLIPLFEDRLGAIVKLGIKPHVFDAKLETLRKNNRNEKSTATIFELNVLGFLAQQDVLTDIETSVGLSGEANPSTVDGTICIEKRPIFVDATLTQEEKIPRGPGYSSVSPNVLIEQVFYKIHKKVSSDKQLARVHLSPTLLFLGLNYNAADQESVNVALQTAQSQKSFPKLSGVFTSSDWWFIDREFFPLQGEHPLNSGEIAGLFGWASNNRVEQTDLHSDMIRVMPG